MKNFKCLTCTKPWKMLFLFMWLFYQIWANPSANIKNSSIVCQERYWALLDISHIQPFSICYPLSKQGVSRHVPNNEKIHYPSDQLPNSGPHREDWAVYGEYDYTPPGIFVHNLEHGAIIFLYHPCAPQVLVKKFKAMARNCTWQHIISTYSNILNKTYPLAILTYSCEYRMSFINVTDIKDFIRNRADSPESETKEGTYNQGLLHPSRPSNPAKSENFCQDLKDSSFMVPMYNANSPNQSTVVVKSKSPTAQSTPRTEEAAWAVGSLLFLLTCLGIGVCYTKLWRQGSNGESFQQSRIWSDENEPASVSVASIVRRFPHMIKTKIYNVRSKRRSSNKGYHRIGMEEVDDTSEDEL